MDDLKEKLRTVPVESIVYHASRNHFSAWLMARGEVQVSQVVLRVKVEDFENPEELRAFLINMGDFIQKLKSKGKVIPFTESFHKEEHNILRLAEGSMGGKGRGVAFTNSLLASLNLDQVFPGVNIRIPRSMTIGTDEFCLLRGAQRPLGDPPDRGGQRHHQAPLPHGLPLPGAHAQAPPAARAR